jgi:tRNA dimethylallyltransferase
MKPVSNKVIVILGPTASGKTALAISLAKKFGGEIISADSRQVYRGMDIGTGKDLRDYRAAKTPYHLIDIVSPRRQYTVAQWQVAAHQTIHDVLRRGKIPIVCGGTGLYVSALVEGYQLSTTRLSAAKTKELRARLSKRSLPQLLVQLKKIDPKTYHIIDKQNRRRVERALEIYYETGTPKSVQMKKQPPAYSFLVLGIKTDLVSLQQRIAIRLQQRLRRGMIAEVKRLRAQGVSWKRLEDFGLEYRWIARHLQNKLSRVDMVTGLEQDIIHYAKRQATWFRKMTSIHWVNSAGEAAAQAKAFLSR